MVLERGGGTCFRRSSVAERCFLDAFDTTLLSYENLNTFLNKPISLRKYMTLHHLFLQQIEDDDIDMAQTVGACCVEILLHNISLLLNILFNHTQ